MKKNSPVLIVEHCTSGLEPINESNKAKKDYRLSGTFTEFDVKNRNDRVYTADRFVPHLNELVKKKEEMGVIYGEFDHPDVFDTSLARVSHTVESLSYDQANNRVVGEIRLLNTHWGKEAKALVDDDCPIFVSSRAAGITESNGQVSLKKLFTYDAVADPGFSSAKMELKSINESLGFTNESANFRIYDLSEDSKFNDLVMDNKNDDLVTKNQMIEYSNYLTEQIQSLSKVLTENIDGKDKEEVLKISEVLENMQTQQSKVNKYLDYLADQIQIVANENVSLKEKSTKLEKTNEQLVGYSNYLAGQVEKNINYSEYIAESLDKSIEFSEYIAENVDKTIKYSDYLAESIEKSIDYSEYIAENLNGNIAYSEYLAENLDQNIVYGEYLAENIDQNISYAKYLAEHLDNNIAYSEYVAENVSDTQAYTNYIAEGLDKTVNIVKGNKIFENLGEDELNFKPENIEQYYSDDEEEKSEVIEPNNIPVGEPAEETSEIEETDLEINNDFNDTEETDLESEETTMEEPSVEGEELETEIVPGHPITMGGKTGVVTTYNPAENIGTFKVDETGEEMEFDPTNESFKMLKKEKMITENNISSSIEKLILEAKKRKASEDNEPHFFEFLTEKNKKFFNELSTEDKEKATFALNESKYYSETDVVNIMNEALTVKKTFEEELLDNMPKELIPLYESLEDKYKTSLISQAKLYPNLNTSNRMEAFWKSRDMEKYSKVKENKQILNESKFIDNSKLSDEFVESFTKRLRY